MILADEADVLEEAFFRAEVSDVSTFEYQQEDFQKYVDFRKIERDLIPDLHSYFLISDERRCEKHDISIDSCGCHNSRERETRIYTLQPESLVEEWVKSLRKDSVFDSIEWKTIGKTRYVLTVRLDRTEITFQCFFNKDEFERYNFEPYALEFGVSFFGDLSAVEQEYCYSWRQLIDDDFLEQLLRDVNRLKETIGADFYEYRPLDDFRDRVRQSLRQYFDESGFEVRREVGEICAAEMTQYSIDTGKSDFVGYDDESKFVVCHCEKQHGWHVHHFVDGRIESAEQTQIVTDMNEKIESKINTFLDIQTNKKTASRFVNVISALFSIGFVVLLFDRLGSISSFLHEQFSLGGLETVGVALLIFDAIAAIVLAVVITLPYYRHYRFGWDIKPFEGNKSALFPNED